MPAAPMARGRPVASGFHAPRGGEHEAQGRGRAPRCPSRSARRSTPPRRAPRRSSSALRARGELGAAGLIDRGLLGRRRASQASCPCSSIIASRHCGETFVRRLAASPASVKAPTATDCDPIAPTAPSAMAPTTIAAGTPRNQMSASSRGRRRRRAAVERDRRRLRRVQEARSRRRSCRRARRAGCPGGARPGTGCPPTPRPARRGRSARPSSPRARRGSPVAVE